MAKRPTLRHMLTQDLGTLTMVGLRVITAPLYPLGDAKTRTHLDTATREAGALTTTVADAIVDAVENTGTRRNPDVKID